MIHIPLEFNSFEFVRLAALRTAQLVRGCKARVPEARRFVLTAQREVAAGKVQPDARVNGQVRPIATSRDQLEALPVPERRGSVRPSAGK